MEFKDLHIFYPVGFATCRLVFHFRFFDLTTLNRVGFSAYFRGDRLGSRRTA
jgi:hypothetical protein